ncbi:MAG TPA: hypothetical protein VHQ87_15320 [Rhizobacter sp.]|nr:hypothetical protein [Rhizobacter sp.]
MAITMQGSWTLRVKGREAAFAQRFIVSGAASGNGSYDGIVGQSVFVTGAQWSLQVQHQPGRQAWRNSAQRIGLPCVEGGLLRFVIASNDGGLDDDHDDLVLACSMPASQADYVVYGAVSTCAGSSAFNPQRDDYLVIDSELDLGSVCARYPKLTEVIKKLYPERLQEQRGLAAGPTPLVIPTGLPNVAVGLLFDTSGLDGVEPDSDEDAVVQALKTTVRRVPFRACVPKAGGGRLAKADLQAIADIRDASLRLRSSVEPAAGLLLRFQHYERTAAEAADGPYTGTGAREDLGSAMTDEQGNYIFRFRRDKLADARPDIIVQVLGSSGQVSFETAPYDKLANMRRIDMCVPRARLRASQDCADDRVIRRVGSMVVAVTDALDVRERMTLIRLPGVRMRQAA